MTRTIWWFLAMQYHYEDTAPGHTYRSKARGCDECQTIAGIYKKFEEQK